MSTVLAFLKALPQLVSMINSLKESIDNLQERRIREEIEEIKTKVNIDLKKIEKATTNEERRRLIRDLNTHLQL